MNNYRKGLKKRRKKSYGEINENLLTKTRFEVAEKKKENIYQQKKKIYTKSSRKIKSITSDR